jgi:4-hydroxyacetophenone monooxygenase
VVFATGSAVDYLDEVEVIGRDGVEIHDFWKGDARAYNGITVPGFPNFFLIYGPNVGGVVAGSLHFMIERAVEFSLKSVYEILQKGVSAIDVKPAALDRFVDWIDAGNRRMARATMSHGIKTRTAVFRRSGPIRAEYWQITRRSARASEFVREPHAPIPTQVPCGRISTQE